MTNSNHRTPSFQVGTFTQPGTKYEVTTYVSVDEDYPGTPVLSIDTWGGVDPSRYTSERAYLNREQWAELAAFAAQMALRTDIERVGSPSTQHLKQADLAEHIKALQYSKNQDTRSKMERESDALDELRSTPVPLDEN